MGSLNNGSSANKMKFPLSHITVVTTQKCNLACKGCYVDTCVHNDLDLEKLKENILLPFVKLGGKTIGFSGGEPLMYDGIIDAIRMAKQCTLFVSLVTNGTLLSYDMAKTLARLGVNSLQISLDSSDEAYNDSIRGKGNKKSVVQAIKNATSAGLSTCLVAIPNRSLLCNFETYVNEARRLKIRTIYIRRAVMKFKEAVLEDEKAFNRELMFKIKELDEKYSDVSIVSGDPLFNLLRIEEKEDKTIPLFSGCSAGITSLAIWPNGIITPCTRVYYPIGDIYEEGLEKIWIGSNVLMELRQRDLQGKCEQCKYRYLCGGCRASAYINIGDICAQDPMCYIK